MPLDEQQTRRILKKLMAELSHEVRTPNGTMISLSQLMLMEETGSLNEKQREYLIAIHQSSIELLKATNHLFTLARVFYGGVELSIEEVDLAQFIPQTIAAARNYWPTWYPSFDIIIEQQIPDELPSIWMDRQWVQQAIIGVLFEAKQKILLTVAHDDISVKLNISTLEYPRFFDEESPRLFLAQAIAEQHGGQLMVNTETQLEIILSLPISKNRPVSSQ